MILVSQFFEYLRFFASLSILRLNVLDQASDAIDIVGEDEATECLYED